ncbi:ATP-binding protein [Aggregatilineales bacterium SYSU G02658]
MIRQINLNRMILTGALMAATVVMVVLNLSQPNAFNSLLNIALTLLVAALIVFGLLMINVLERRWDQQEVALQAVEADNMALMKRISQRADQLSTLNQLSVLMTQTLSTSDVLDSTVSSAALITQADAVAVFVLTDQTFERVRDAGFNDSPAYLTPVTSPTLTSMTPTIIHNLRHGQREPMTALLADGFQSMLELPFVSNGRLLGVVGCYFRRPSSFKDDEIGIMLSFAALLSNALQNAERYEQTDYRREVASSNLQALLEAREAYTHMLVHDLRSPLTAVATSLKMLASTVDETDAHHETIQRLTSAGLRGLRKVMARVDSLLDIAKMESGVMSLQRTPTQVAKLVENVFKDLEPLAEGLEVRLYATITPLPPLMLDADKMERALLNLVDNALKYTPQGSTVRVEAVRSGPDRLQLRVADSGSGVPDSHKERLFDRFVQIEDRQVVRRGVGLGLSLCKAVADAHEGRIWIEDNPTGGAIFIIEVPMIVAPISEKPPTEAELPTKPAL